MEKVELSESLLIISRGFRRNHANLIYLISHVTVGNDTTAGYAIL